MPILKFLSQSLACLLWITSAILGIGSEQTEFPSSPEDSAPPNILFILTDDQSLTTLSCYGTSHPTTPNLEQFAAEGMRFSQAYVMPQCTPTRAALLSGWHTARNGMWHVIPWYGTPFAPVAEPAFREEFLPEQARLPRLLRERGYTTAMAGKWHLTHNSRQGFYTHLNPNSADQFGFDFVAPPGPGSQNEGDKWVDHLTDYAIDFIHTERSNPWFFYLAHHTLHGKVSAPASLVSKYLHQGAPKEGLGNATYLAAIEHLDNSVGRLLQALQESGQHENTLVVFLSDNGGVDTQYNLPQWTDAPLDGSSPLTIKEQQFENAPLRAGKGSVYEGGIRVPCLVRWPQRISSGTSSTPIHVVDWLPTLLDAAGASAGEVASLGDGLSLLPLMQATAMTSPETPATQQLKHRALYWYLPLYDLRWASTPCAALREGEWKLIEFFGDWYDAQGRYHRGQHIELYNLAQDPGETRNAAPRAKQRAERMRQQLHDWIESTGCVLPSANPNFDAQRALFETKNKPEGYLPYASGDLP